MVVCNFARTATKLIFVRGGALAPRLVILYQVADRPCGIFSLDARPTNHPCAYCFLKYAGEKNINQKVTKKI
jgi:hypothetical protein